jgi:hypothetical protein
MGSDAGVTESGGKENDGLLALGILRIGGTVQYCGTRIVEHIQYSTVALSSVQYKVHVQRTINISGNKTSILVQYYCTTRVQVELPRLLYSTQSEAEWLNEDLYITSINCYSTTVLQYIITLYHILYIGQMYTCPPLVCAIGRRR